MKVVMKCSITHGNWRTSISVEPLFWQAFKEIAKRKGVKLAVLALDINAEREEGQTLSSAVRVHVLEDARQRAFECEERERLNEQHASELRRTIRALTGTETKDGHAPIAAVIAGGRANG